MAEKEKAHEVQEELNLDAQVSVKSIAGWKTGFARLNSIGDVNITPEGVARLTEMKSFLRFRTITLYSVESETENMPHIISTIRQPAFILDLKAKMIKAGRMFSRIKKSRKHLRSRKTPLRNTAEKSSAQELKNMR